jgi:hypothetical protein
MRYTLLVVACALLIGGCATPSKTVSHEALAGHPDKPLPRKVLLLPAEVRLHEISAGGVVERVEAWSTAASENAASYVRDLAASKHPFDVVEHPAFSSQEKTMLDQHIALYDLVAGSAYFSRNSVYPAWRERAKTFDYTLGPGMKGLADRTGIDAALIVSGSDYISSAGRKAAMVMGVLVGALAGALVVPQGGISFISVGIVDLRTGDLLWFGTDQSGVADFRDEKELRKMLDGLFQAYPGATRAKTSEPAS